MKKIFTILFLMGSVIANAQVQHVKGIFAAEALGGMSLYGYYAGLGASYYFSRNLYLKATLNYEKKEKEEAGGITRTQSSYYMDIPAAFTFYSINNIFYFNVVGGVTAGVYNENDIGSFEVPSSFKYGGLLGGEMEVFINSKIAVLINGNVKYLIGSEFGSKRSYYGIGIKYSF